MCSVNAMCTGRLKIAILPPSSPPRGHTLSRSTVASPSRTYRSISPTHASPFCRRFRSKIGLFPFRARCVTSGWLARYLYRRCCYVWPIGCPHHRAQSVWPNGCPHHRAQSVWCHSRCIVDNMLTATAPSPLHAPISGVLVQHMIRLPMCCSFSFPTANC